MSEQPPSNFPDGGNFPPGPYPPSKQGGAGVPTRPPFSKVAIWGFVIACVSLFYFGFLGIVGVVLSSRALRDIRTGRVHGRGLAIAGAVIGVASFLFYVVSLFMRNN